METVQLGCIDVCSFYHLYSRKINSAWNSSSKRTAERSEEGVYLMRQACESPGDEGCSEI